MVLNDPLPNFREVGSRQLSNGTFIISDRILLSPFKGPNDNRLPHYRPLIRR